MWMRQQRRRYRLGRRRLWAVVTGAALLLSALAVTAPGRDRDAADPSPLVPDMPPAAGTRSAAGAPDGPATPGAAAARRAGGHPAEAADRRTTTRRSDPPFEPAAPPSAGVTTPRVGHLRLGGFDKPAAGVQSRAGVPRGVPLDEGAGGLRKGRSTRTLAVRRTDTDVFSAAGITWTGEERAAVSVALRYHVPAKGWTGWRVAGVASADRDPTVSRRSGRGPAPTRRRPTGANRRRPGAGAPNWCGSAPPTASR
jgi:hypothetical protein